MMPFSKLASFIVSFVFALLDEITSTFIFSHRFARSPSFHIQLPAALFSSSSFFSLCSQLCSTTSFTLFLFAKSTHTHKLSSVRVSFDDLMLRAFKDEAFACNSSLYCFLSQLNNSNYRSFFPIDSCDVTQFLYEYCIRLLFARCYQRTSLISFHLSVTISSHRFSFPFQYALRFHSTNFRLHFLWCETALHTDVCVC